MTITVFERPVRLEFTVTGKRMDIPTTFTFADADGGTMLVGTFDVRPKGLMSVLLPMLSPMVRRGLSKQHVQHDVYFGPVAPDGKEADWIQTVPGKGWNVLFRLYGPLQPWFDKTWRPGDPQLVD